MSTPSKSFNGSPTVDFTLTKDKFPDGSFVRAAPLLDHRKRLADLARVFEVAKEQHSICEIANIDQAFAWCR